MDGFRCSLIQGLKQPSQKSRPFCFLLLLASPWGGENYHPSSHGQPWPWWVPDPAPFMLMPRDSWAAPETWVLGLQDPSHPIYTGDWSILWTTCPGLRDRGRPQGVGEGGRGRLKAVRPQREPRLTHIHQDSCPLGLILSRPSVRDGVQAGAQRRGTLPTPGPEFRPGHELRGGEMPPHLEPPNLTTTPPPAADISS